VLNVVLLVTKGDYSNMTIMSLLASGAIANDMDTTIFFMEDSVWALRKEELGKDTQMHSPFPEVDEKYNQALVEGRMMPWWELLPDIKELGIVKVLACGQALDILGLEESDLVDFVDDIIGVTGFMDLVAGADRMISI
jgi:peroxiredoxin family protein